MSRAKEYRDRAEDCFVLAEAVSDPVESGELRQIAHAFLRLAERLETQEPNGPERTRI
jgi:hypothetical protein